MKALWTGHLNVVNRLLNCKQTDINVQSKVSGMSIALHLISKFSFLLFCWMYFLIKILEMVKKM